MKKPKVENLGLVNFWFTGLHRPNGAKIWGFWIFPHPLTCLGGVEKCQKSKSFSEIWLWKRIRSIHVLSICTTKCIGSHLPDTITRVEAMDILHRDSQKLALLKENILLLPNRGPSRLRLSEFFQILHYWNFYFLLNFNHWSRLQLDKYTWLYHKQSYVVITRFCRDTGYVALTCFCRESCHDITYVANMRFLGFVLSRL